MRLLDLYCGAGGATKGYMDAGFTFVVGVDIESQPNYPGHMFYRMDAIDFLTRMDVSEFDLIHASPPCQRWAGGFVKHRDKHPDYIAATRSGLRHSGRPYVIENVPRAPLVDPVMICGGALGCMTDELQLHRHRNFEASWPFFGASCMRPRRLTVSVVGNGTPSGNRKTIGRNPSIAEKREAMGIDWMTRKELSEAIPPAYTKFIGEQFLAQVRSV